MNFEQMRTLWDSQNEEKLFAFNEAALERLVEKDFIAAAQDLKALERVAIAVLAFLGVATLVDTFFNGNEYFQIVSSLLELGSAYWLWTRRRKREKAFKQSPDTLIENLEIAMERSRKSIQRGQDLLLLFTIVIVYGISARLIVYGWNGNEVKLAASVACFLILFTSLKLAEHNTHTPRLRKLESLHAKILEAEETA